MTLFLVHTGPENKPCFPSEQEMLLQLSKVWFPALLLRQNAEYFITITLASTHGNLIPTVGMACKNPCDIASLYCGDLKCWRRAKKKKINNHVNFRHTRKPHDTCIATFFLCIPRFIYKLLPNQHARCCYCVLHSYVVPTCFGLSDIIKDA